MRIGPMPLPIAIRLAGATQIALRPDGYTPPNSDPLLRHCNQPMQELTEPATGSTVRYVCRTCGTDITHIDGHGQPANITPHHRHILEQTHELWTVGQNTMAPLNSRGPGGTSHD